MESQKSCVNFKIRRYDLYDNPCIEDRTIELNPTCDYSLLKKEIFKFCEISADSKVVKFRNKNGLLIPLSFLFDEQEDFFYVDVTNISYTNKNGASLLQDAYVDAVRQKLKSVESRIAQAELLLPQLEWRRQAHMEDTVNALSYKVAFLHRRFDELKPQFRSKVSETMA